MSLDNKKIACPLDCYDACQGELIEENIKGSKENLVTNGKLCVNFANLLKDQDQFQTTIVYDVMSKTDLNGKYLIVDGQVPWSSQSENLIYGYDFIDVHRPTFFQQQK